MKKLVVIAALAALAGWAQLLRSRPCNRRRRHKPRPPRLSCVSSFAVDNMTCATCPITVRTAMSRVDGVRSVSVDFASKRATVTYDPARATTEAIAAASTNAGYPAHLVTPAT